VGENRQAKGEIENENVQPEPANSRLRQQVDEKNSASPMASRKMRSFL
jgi:hypothetical protein